MEVNMYEASVYNQESKALRLWQLEKHDGCVYDTLLHHFTVF